MEFRTSKIDIHVKELKPIKCIYSHTTLRSIKNEFSVGLFFIHLWVKALTDRP